MIWTVLKGVALLLVLGAAALLVAGQLGFLRGKPPTDLGVREGLLKPPSTTPNSVHSQAGRWPGHPQQAYAQVQPLPLVRGDPAATLAALKTAASALPGAQLMLERDDYLYFTATTRWLKFTDDLELWVDRSAGVVQVRSASRLGRKDFGVNRARVEQLRAGLAAAR